MYKSVELYNKPEEKMMDSNYSEMTSFQLEYSQVSRHKKV